MSFTTKAASIFRLFKQAIRGDEQNFTEGSIDKAIFLLSVPMILEMVMESFFAVIDVFFVSQLHDNDAVATIGLTESVLTLIYSVAIGLSMGATAMVARRIGEKDPEAAGVAAVQAIGIGLIISILISAVGFFYSQEILRLMGANTNIVENYSSYTRWMLGGNITIMMLFLINAVFRGAGDASIAMRSLWLANGLNIILDPIFIFGLGPIPAFGVEGAAIATTIGRGTGVLYQVYHLVNGKGLIKIHKENLALRWDIIVRLLKLSIGGTGQFLIASASWIFLIRIMSTFGSAALAGYTIAIRVIVFAILPAWGMANASATLVGQNLGAGQPERAEKSVWRSGFLNMLFLAFITVVFLSLADQIIGLFTTDAEVLRNGIQCLRIVSLGYIFYAYGMVIAQSFNGAGDTKTPTILNFFGFWMFQIPLAYLLSITFEYGPTGTYLAIVIAESVLAIVSILIFRRGKWKTVKV
jgi:putative MATE family efflux protein